MGDTAASTAYLIAQSILELTSKAAREEIVKPTGRKAINTGYQTAQDEANMLVYILKKFFSLWCDCSTFVLTQYHQIV